MERLHIPGMTGKVANFRLSLKNVSESGNLGLEENEQKNANFKSI
jgi:hypothetical protein